FDRFGSIMSRFGRAAAMVSVLLVAGCTSGDGSQPPVDPPARTAQTALPDAATTVVDGAEAAELALATSRALYQSAPAVVLVAAGEAAAVGRAGEVAVALGVPLLVTPAPAEAGAPAEQDAPAEPDDPAERNDQAELNGPAEPDGPAGPDASPAPGPGATGEPRAEIDRLGARWVITAGTGAADWARTVTWPPHVV